MSPEFLPMQSVKNQLRFHLNLGCCLRWHLPRSIKIKVLEQSQTKYPHLFANLKRSHSQNTLQNGIIIQEKSGDKFWGGSWPSQTCPGTACRCFFQISKYVNTLPQPEGLVHYQGKKMSSVIRFVWRPDSNVMVDLTKGFDKSQTCTSRHDHLGKF